MKICLQVVFAMAVLTFLQPLILRLLFWCFHQLMKTSIIMFYPTSGCRKKRFLYVSEETMFHTMYGNGRAT